MYYLLGEVNRKKNWTLLEHSTDFGDYKEDGLHFNEQGIAKYALEVRHLVRKIVSNK